MGAKYDFSGWATRNDLECSDGRTIRRGAFADCDGKTVPLVWNHDHTNPSNVLGHALLENRDEGVYAYCSFNETAAGEDAKACVKHGDVKALSIYANKLKQQGGNVLHGAIREVSLVLAGANPGAYIDSILAHGDDLDDAMVIPMEEPELIMHSDEDELAEENESAAAEEETNGEDNTEEIEHSDDEEESIEDVIGTMNDKQRNVMCALIAEAAKTADMTHNDDEGDEDMKHNVFDEESNANVNVLSHSEIEAIFTEAKRNGSLKDAYLAHAVTDDDGNTVEYGMANIDYLFPDYQNVTDRPQFIQRDMGWVQKVMNSVHHTPFSRIKSIFANITMDEARAKGYIKGNKKDEEVFSLLKRTTDPQTIYKKQKMDRDDKIDITSFDVVAWLKVEMRMMLDEEIARAILIGDGRSSGDDDKIDPSHIRPIWTDSTDVYVVRTVVDQTGNNTDSAKAKARIKAIIKARKNYKGSGNPTLFTTEDDLTDMLLIEDSTGRDIYDSVEKLATKLRVKEIVTVPVMEDQTREVSGKNYQLHGIVVNLNDYNVGADKGGAVNMFEDFDIDYNQEKYLIETRASGALVKPYSAIVIEEEVAGE